MTFLKLFLTSIVVASGAVWAIDESQFRPTTFHAFEVEHPVVSPKGIWVDSSIPAFSMEVSVTGKVRSIEQAKHKFIDKLKTDEPENREMLSQYEEELEVIGEGVTHWIPTQKKLLSVLKKEMEAGKHLIIYLRYFGTVDSERVYLMIHYSHREGTEKPLQKKTEADFKDDPTFL